MENHIAIINLINQYFHGVYEGDIAKLMAVFHPKAVLSGDVKGIPYYKNLSEYIEVVRKRESPQAKKEKFSMKILALDVTGPIAMVKTHCPMLGYNYQDYLGLVCENGQWKIISKVFTHLD